jgi:hypothetical protein
VAERSRLWEVPEWTPMPPSSLHSSCPKFQKVPGGAVRTRRYCHSTGHTAHTGKTALQRTSRPSEYRTECCPGGLRAHRHKTKENGGQRSFRSLRRIRELPCSHRRNIERTCRGGMGHADDSDKQQEERHDLDRARRETKGSGIHYALAHLSQSA